LVIATGGPSIPKMGATGFAYDIARQLRPQDRGAPPGLGAADASAATTLDLLRELSGVALDPRHPRCGKAAFDEAACCSPIAACPAL
jgi:predicted flavoprotein YhiN